MNIQQNPNHRSKFSIARDFDLLCSNLAMIDTKFNQTLTRYKTASQNEAIQSLFHRIDMDNENPKLTFSLPQLDLLIQTIENTNENRFPRHETNFKVLIPEIFDLFREIVNLIISFNGALINSIGDNNSLDVDKTEMKGLLCETSDGYQGSYYNPFGVFKASGSQVKSNDNNESGYALRTGDRTLYEVSFTETSIELKIENDSNKSVKFIFNDESSSLDQCKLNIDDQQYLTCLRKESQPGTSATLAAAFQNQGFIRGRVNNA